VRVAIDDPPRPDSQLVLSARGAHLAVGGFLTLPERLELAAALRAALHSHRTGGANAAAP